MTQEEKARAYDEVVARINKAVSDGLVSENFGRDMLGIAESDDERIRKAIKCYVEDMPDTYGFAHGIGKKEMLSYLEKQKERTMPNSTELIEMWDKEKAILEEKDFRGDEWRLAYNAFLDGFARGCSVKQKEQAPGTTKDNPINPFDTKLFQDGVKEGRRLEREDMLKEQKPAEWSEEDARCLRSIKCNLEYLKREDKAYRSYDDQAELQKELNFISKVLTELAPPQPHWKPSEEQIDWLATAARLSKNTPTIRPIIESLYNELKKL